MPPEFFPVQVGACHRDLSVVGVAPGVHIAFLDVVGDLELIDAALRELLAIVPADVEVVFGGDTVGLLVAHHLAVLSGLPYVVARKKRTPVMTDPLTAEATSVAATTPSTFWLGQAQAARLRDRRVLVVDEVTSTGATLRALTALATRAGAARVTEAVIATEGEPRDDVLSVLHLPVWHTPGPPA